VTGEKTRGPADGTLPTSLTLPPNPAAVRDARAFVRHHCDRHGLDADLCDTAVLLTSETVTNAFTYGHSEARLRVSWTPARLRVEVGDDNSRHPRRASQDADALDGRGLAILELLAARWGVRDDAFGKTVWFEIRR
jgi:anti-sigma regulatory factor (Ser/Thr protein kinase)